MTGLRLRLILTLMIVAVGVKASPGQTSASPALARADAQTVTVRQFLLPFVPAPGMERPGAPQAHPGEFRLSFALADMQAFDIDGKPMDADVWTKRLETESPVLYAGHAIAAPGESAGRNELVLPAELAAAYREDAIVLMGKSAPRKQEPVKNPQLPQGPTPRFGTASMLDGGWLRLVERHQMRSHYDARLPDAPGASHVYQTVSTTTTRDFRPDGARAWTPDGKPVASGELQRALAKEAAVVISGDGKAVDPFFLKLIRPGTLVIAAPLPAPRVVQ